MLLYSCFFFMYIKFNSCDFLSLSNWLSYYILVVTAMLLSHRFHCFWFFELNVASPFKSPKSGNKVDFHSRGSGEATFSSNKKTQDYFYWSRIYTDYLIEFTTYIGICIRIHWALDVRYQWQKRNQVFRVWIVLITYDLYTMKSSIVILIGLNIHTTPVESIWPQAIFELCCLIILKKLLYWVLVTKLRYMLSRFPNIAK